MKLHNKYAVITGASEGLGAAIAKAYVREGATVMLCARRKDKLESFAEELKETAPDGVRVHYRVADVAKESDLENLFTHIEELFPRLDILVNNAGVYGPMGPLEEIDWAAWVHSVQINLFGLAYACRLAIPFFKKQKSGRIINLSGGGATKPLPNISAYAVAKAGVVRLTETLAHELRDFGVGVNAIAPGLLGTRLTDELIDAGSDNVGGMLHKRIKAARDEGKVTPVELGADLSVYLGSGESDGVTGRLLAAQWDPWPFEKEVVHDLHESDIYTLRRITGRDRGKQWEKD